MRSGADAGEAAHDGRVGLRLVPGLDRLPVARAEPRHEPGRDDRLADIGVGPGDEETLHTVQALGGSSQAKARLYRPLPMRQRGVDGGDAFQAT